MLESIGKEAFCDCSSLETLNIPDHFKSLGENVSWGCKKMYQFENHVIYVGKWVVDVDITAGAITLRKDTVGICDNAFSSCNSLKSLAIPDSIAYMGKSGLYSYYDLETIIYCGTPLQWVAIMKDASWDTGVSTDYSLQYHQWNCGVVTVEPTDASDGIKIFTCPVCGDIETVVIPAFTPISGDVNFDSFINASDVALLRRYLASWDGIELL